MISTPSIATYRKQNPIKKEPIVGESKPTSLSERMRQKTLRYSRQIALALALAMSGASPGPFAGPGDTRANQTAYGGQIGVPSSKATSSIFRPVPPSRPGTTGPGGASAGRRRRAGNRSPASSPRSRPAADIFTPAGNGRQLLRPGHLFLLDPGRPRLIDGGLLRKSASSENITTISIDGGFLYAFDSERGLVVHSLADPLYPRAIRVVEGGPADAVGIAGGRIFTSARTWLGDTLLQVFDNSRKNFPKQVTSRKSGRLREFPPAVCLAARGGVRAERQPVLPAAMGRSAAAVGQRGAGRSPVQRLHRRRQGLRLRRIRRQRLEPAPAGPPGRPRRLRQRPSPRKRPLCRASSDGWPPPPISWRSSTPAGRSAWPASSIPSAAPMSWTRPSSTAAWSCCRTSMG